MDTSRRLLQYDFRQQIAVVTGSGKGRGKAIALAFPKSRECRGIVENSRMLTEAPHVADEIKKYPRCDSIAIEADMSKEGDYNKLIEETKRDYSRIDVLVNDTRIQQEVPFEETSTEVWQKIIAVDLTGPFVCSREVVKQMLNQNPKGGCIINISSVHQIIPKPHYIPYSTSKAGIEMMTKTMALELAQDNIRVKVVAPGAIETDMNQDFKENKAESNKFLRRIPLGRIGTPEV